MIVTVIVVLLLHNLLRINLKNIIMNPPCFADTNKNEYNLQTWRLHVTIKKQIIYT